MIKFIVGIFAGLVAWAAVATLLNLALRQAIPGYTEAEPTFSFTLPMMIGRLALAVVASLLAGAIIDTIAPGKGLAPWVAGLVLVALFLPIHIQIGARLPLWYHLFFLVTLAPWVAIGARLRQSMRPGRRPAWP